MYFGHKAAATLISLLPPGPGGHCHQLGGHLGSGPSEPWGKPQPVSHYAGALFPGAEPLGVCGGPGQGAQRVLGQLSAAGRHRAATPGPA